MQIHFLNFEKNIDMAQNSTQITGITFLELKAEKRQLVTFPGHTSVFRPIPESFIFLT